MKPPSFCCSCNNVSPSDLHITSCLQRLSGLVTHGSHSALMHWRWLKLECYSKAGSLERRKLIKLPPLDLWELWQHWQSITLSLDRSLSCQSCSFPLSCCVLFRTIGSIQNCTTLVSKKDNYRTSKQPLIRYHVTVTNTRWMKLISPCDWIAFLIIQSWWTVNFQLHSFILGLHVIYIYYRIIVIYYYYSSCHYTGHYFRSYPFKSAYFWPAASRKQNIWVTGEWDICVLSTNIERIYKKKNNNIPETEHL